MSKARGLADLGNVYDDGALSNRNLIINGAMQVWQRGSSGFGHNAYFADRFTEATNTNDALSISLVPVPSGGETGLPKRFTNMAKFALTAGNTGSLNDLRQRVEHPKGLMGETVTLSYYIKASANCTINNRRLAFTNVTNGPTHSDLPLLSVTTGWQRVVNTVTLGSNSSAVFGATSYLDVILGLPINTTVDVYITGVQLELGDTATSFEHRSYGDELARCERFYETGRSKLYCNAAMTGMTLYVPHRTTKRTNPTVTVVSGSHQPTSIEEASIEGIKAYRNTGNEISYEYTADAEL